MGTKAPDPAPQFSRDPVRESEWQQFKSDLEDVRARLEDPFLMYNDGARICDLMGRLCDLMFRDGFKGDRP